jgi:hypothetical protein
MGWWRKKVKGVQKIGLKKPEKRINKGRSE